MDDSRLASLYLLRNRGGTFACGQGCPKLFVFFNCPSFQPQPAGFCSQCLFFEKLYTRIDCLLRALHLCGYCGS
jgi:hypothetical protein